MPRRAAGDVRVKNVLPRSIRARSQGQVFSCPFGSCSSLRGCLLCCAAGKGFQFLGRGPRGLGGGGRRGRGRRSNALERLGRGRHPTGPASRTADRGHVRRGTADRGCRSRRLAKLLLQLRDLLRRQLRHAWQEKLFEIRARVSRATAPELLQKVTRLGGQIRKLGVAATARRSNLFDKRRRILLGRLLGLRHG